MSGKRKIGGADRLMELTVGVVFFVALALLASYTVLLKRDLFAGKGPVRQAKFESVGGVQKGAKVLLRGLQVGAVEALALDDAGQNILLEMQLQQDLGFFQDHICEIRSSSILGGSYIYLELGTPDSGAYPPEQPLRGKLQEDPLRKANELMDKLDTSVNDIREYVRRVIESEGTLNKLIYDPTLYDEATTAFTTLKNAGEHIRLAADDISSLEEEINGALADARAAVGKLGEAGDSIKTAGVSVDRAGTSVTTAADEFRAAVTDARGAIADAKAGKGSIGKLMTDETLYNDLRTAATDFSSAAKDFRGLTGKLAEGDSTISKLMNDEGELYATVKGSFGALQTTVDEARLITDKIRSGEGNLGKIIYDEKLYEDLRKTMTDVQGAVQDFREQAPISTFGSLVFGAL